MVHDGFLCLPYERFFKYIFHKTNDWPVFSYGWRQISLNIQKTFFIKLSLFFGHLSILETVDAERLKQQVNKLFTFVISLLRIQKLRQKHFH